MIRSGPLWLAAWLCLAGSLAGPVSAEDAATPGPTPPSRTCTAVEGDLAAARAAGRLKDAVIFYEEAGRAPVGCAPKTLFCLGRSVALGHVEAAYAAAASGTRQASEPASILEAGRHYGEPWPLLVGLGDAATVRARETHDPEQWSAASLLYQQAVSALDEPALCDGEPPQPDARAYGEIVRKMSLATLLATPLHLFHDRCAPCSMAFLAHGAIEAAHPRALPITFEDDSARITPEGAATAKALADCAAAQKWSTLAVTVHTDERGSAPLNLALSQQRIASLQAALRQAGFTGVLEAQPKGKSEPLAIDEPRGLTAAEVERANRRVELRSVVGPSTNACTSAEVPKP